MVQVTKQFLTLYYLLKKIVLMPHLYCIIKVTKLFLVIVLHFFVLVCLLFFLLFFVCLKICPYMSEINNKQAISYYIKIVLVDVVKSSLLFSLKMSFSFSLSSYFANQKNKIYAFTVIWDFNVYCCINMHKRKWYINFSDNNNFLLQLSFKNLLAQIARPSLFWFIAYRFLLISVSFS